MDPEYTPPRSGDIRHSQADLTKIRSILDYEPTHSVADGLDVMVPWYVAHLPSR